MNIDFNTIITSLTSSAIVAGAIAYVLKQSFDKTIDLKLELLKEKSKSEINESNRRNSQLFNDQRDILKTVLTLVYRCRNSAKRTIDYILDTDPELSEKYYLRENFDSYSDSLVQLLYEERALMPPIVFSIAHDMKSDLVTLKQKYERRSFNKRQGNSLSEQEIIELNNLYTRIDRMYELMTTEIHERLGIE